MHDERTKTSSNLTNNINEDNNKKIQATIN